MNKNVIKNVIVEIKPLKESLKDFVRTIEKIKKGEKVTKRKGVAFSDVESFRKFFSKKRMELLSAVKHKKPKSIYQLAKLLKREYKNVYDDVGLLEELGLITKDNKKVNVDFNKLNIEVVV